MATLREKYDELGDNSLLSVKNAHTFDKRITFQEEGHIYTVDGETKDLISATTFLKNFHDEFNADLIIEGMMKKDKYKDPSNEYYGMSAENIKKLWLENGATASEAGTKMHANIEYFYNGLPVDNESVEYKQFLDFYRDHKNLEMLRTEWCVFSEMLKITGSIDAVFIDRNDGSLLLGDWKRINKELTPDSYGKHCKFPFENLPDCKLYHYSLQLNLYRVILEKFYGKIIKEMFLVVFHPDNKDGKYKKVNVKRLEKEGEYLLDFRKKQLIELGYPEERFKSLNLKYKIDDIKKQTENTSNVSFESDDEVVEVKSLMRQRNKIPDTLSNNNPLPIPVMNESRSLLMKKPFEQPVSRSLLRNKTQSSPEKKTPVKSEFIVPIFEPEICISSIPDEKDENILEKSLDKKGKKWTKTEHDQFVKAVLDGISFRDIADIHQRTKRAILLRVYQHVIDISENGEDIDQACIKFRVTRESVDKFKKYKEDSKEKRKKKPEKDDEIEVEEPTDLDEENKKIAELQKQINDLKLKKENKKVEIRREVLSDKQQEAYDLIKQGKNIFLTGSAGHGKTFLIKKIARDLKHIKNIGITSTTGTSAILIGGTTLHSYLGIGLGKDDVSSLYIKIKRNKKILDRWLDLDILIIDEISMLFCDLFDKLEHLGRVIKQNPKPFGGIQLILSGDYLQLPCISSNLFCFDAKTWKECIQHTVNLTYNFRQSHYAFQKCLDEIRIGEVTTETLEILKSRVGVELKNDFGILPTKLYSLNKNVDDENSRELDNLCIKNPGLQFFEYDVDYKVHKKGLRDVEEKIRKNCNIPFNLQLCVGCQVMLLFNLDLNNQLCNGSRGVIVSFTETNLPIVKFLNGLVRTIDYKTWEIDENGEKVISYTQIPLKIAYAISIHKSQGLSLDYTVISCSGIFTPGQFYVALSRVRSLEGLSLTDFDPKYIITDERVKEFYRNLS
jgi:ATP-dependent DNA helicase PIF1